jgi:sulfate adenylyltransferase subunit 1 (EFTu-like GTPase family)
MIDNLVWKSNTELEQTRKQSLSVMEHHANRQIASLQEQANVLIRQAQEIKDRVKLAYSIEQAIHNFEPVPMKEYSLYEHKGTLILTLIEPFNSPPYDKFLTTVRKLGDSTWEEVTKE